MEHRYSKIIDNPRYKEHLNRIAELEIDRIYCHHDMVHFLDTARIAHILALTEQIKASKDEIYAAALLHDIGRDEQYIEGTKHEKASSIIAPEILRQCGYEEGEIFRIVEAIREHGNAESARRRDLSGIIYRADKLSRKCYICKAFDSCHKAIEKRNMYIKY